MKEPIDLRQALHLCLKLENQNFRENHAFSNRNNTLQHRRAFQNTPPIPARRVEPKRFEGGRPPFFPTNKSFTNGKDKNGSKYKFPTTKQ